MVDTQLPCQILQKLQPQTLVQFELTTLIVVSIDTSRPAAAITLHHQPHPLYSFTMREARSVDDDGAFGVRAGGDPCVVTVALLPRPQSPHHFSGQAVTCAQMSLLGFGGEGLTARQVSDAVMITVSVSIPISVSVALVLSHASSAFVVGIHITHIAHVEAFVVQHTPRCRASDFAGAVMRV